MNFSEWGLLRLDTDSIFIRTLGCNCQVIIDLGKSSRRKGSSSDVTAPKQETRQCMNQWEPTHDVMWRH